MKKQRSKIGVTLIRIGGGKIAVKNFFKNKCPCIKAEFSAGVGRFGDKPWIMETTTSETDEKENISSLV